MKRKLLLLVGTFLVVLSAVIAYEKLIPAIIPEQTSPEDIDVRKELIPSSDGGLTGPDSTYGDNLVIVETDPRETGGRPKRIYTVEHWEKTDGGVYLLTKPEVKLFQKDGQQITLVAKRGEVLCDWIDGKPKVRSGFLKGNVRIFIDRAKDDARRVVPAEERPEVVKIYTEKIKFSNPDLEIENDLPIRLLSKEADIFGRGISLTWSENPRELVQLKIKQGRKMVVHDAGGKSPLLVTPGQQSDDSGTVASATGVPATMPASAPAGDKNGMRSNVFVANFLAGKKDVYVHSGGRSMTGARKLSLTFEFEPSKSDMRSAPEPEPESGPEDIGPTDLTDSEPGVIAPPKAPKIAKVDKAADTQPAGAKKAEPLIIEWDGPMVLVPKGRTPKPSSKRYTIAATGDLITLNDEKSAATCASFSYDNAAQTGALVGDSDRRAELRTIQDERIVAQKIRFDRGRGQAWLDGQGYMIRQLAAPITAVTRPTTKPADKTDRIDWTEGVMVKFGTDSVTKKQYIKEATFQGGVKLKQGKTGDLVNCDKLYVKMERTDTGRAQLKQAVATGNAFARQEGSDIRANMITVNFEKAPTPAAVVADTKTDKRTLQRVRPSTLLAEGKVRVSDDRGKEPVVATADKLVSNVSDRSAILTGKPASLQQGKNTLSGNIIKLRQERIPFRKKGRPEVIETRQYAEVVGAGQMKFMTDKDMNGRTLGNPRPINIAWTKSMIYQPKKVVGGLAREHSAANFKGDVTVKSGDDRMAAQEMEALFVEPVSGPKPAPATMPAGPASLDGDPEGGPVTMANYSQRKMVRLTANKRVVLSSHRLGPKKELLRRMYLQGDNLVYNIVTGVVRMDKSGAMIAEDYRPPAPKKATDAADESQSIERPMLTVFQWKDVMELSQKERVVIMKGGVAMVHRSGKFVISQIENLKVPDYGKALPAGRKTSLRCDELLARFDPPKPQAPKAKTATSKPASGQADPFDVGPKIGSLKFFNATGNVNLVDGSKQIVGQRLIYSRLKELVQVYGYLANKPKADAYLIDKDIINNTERVVKSPVILWWRGTKANGFKEKIEAEGVSID